MKKRTRYTIPQRPADPPAQAVEPLLKAAAVLAEACPPRLTDAPPLAKRFDGDLPAKQAPAPDPEDPWVHRSERMRCRTCIWFVPKGLSDLGRCRRNAPTFNGYPAVFTADWCGEHRLSEHAA